MTDLEKMAAALATIDEYQFGDIWDSMWLSFQEIIEKGRNAEHSGDCTDECHSCQRCFVDEYIANAQQKITDEMNCVDYRNWALDLCSLLDGIEASDDKKRETLIRHRFQIARNYGMMVESIGAGKE